jgi:hypothetical protein
MSISNDTLFVQGLNSVLQAINQQRQGLPKEAGAGILSTGRSGVSAIRVVIGDFFDGIGDSTRDNFITEYPKSAIDQLFVYCTY